LQLSGDVRGSPQGIGFEAHATGYGMADDHGCLNESFFVYHYRVRKRAGQKRINAQAA
jgi:hypothetical protein